MQDHDFQKLAVAELDSVYRLACHLAHSRQEAEDLVQETFLRAFRGAGTFRLAEHGIRPWLFKILHNVIYTRGERSARERDILHELHAQSSPQAPAPAHAIDLTKLNWDEIDERLKQAINDLPMPFRVVFLLAALEGLKYREIADVTEMPIGTVMSRLSRARALLASRLVDLGAEHGFGGAVDPT